MSMNYRDTRKRNPVGIDFTDCEPLTEQHHKEECDILNIVKKYDKLQIDLSQFMFDESDCMDITDAPTYLEAMNQVSEANSLFDGLPARIRARFANSPNHFLEFMQDDRNIDEIEKMGLNAKHLKKAPKTSPEGNSADPVPPIKKTNKTQPQAQQDGEQA
ncbi:internal scaffolding protein [Microviridae sp.]|nr:internal scaffolding protein [Microviridae sp.]